MHIDYNEDTNISINDGIRSIIGKNNPDYEINEKFANLLLKQLQKTNTIKTSILVREQVLHNQDLSPNVILIEIGNKNSSEKEVKLFIEALQKALKAINENN